MITYLGTVGNSRYSVGLFYLLYTYCHGAVGTVCTARLGVSKP